MGFEEIKDAVSETVIESVQAPSHAVTRADSRFQAVLVQYSKKAPAQAFEVAVSNLNPLAARALANLPRAGNVPVIRAIGKEDALGFTFLFKVDPAELVASCIPAVLERWDGKYETARAKAFPPPPATEAPRPLAPRSPFRKQTGSQPAEGEQAREVFVRDLSVVDRALANYEAQVVAASMGQCGEQVVMEPVTQEGVQPRIDSPAWPHGQQEVFYENGEVDEDDLIDPYAREAAALADIAQQGSLDLDPQPAQDGAGGWVDLSPLYIYVGQDDACPAGAPQVVDADGEIWTSWAKVVFEPHGPDVFKPVCEALALDCVKFSATQREQARAIQSGVAARVAQSAPALAQALRACTKSLTAAQRRNRGSAAMSEAPHALDLLDELLVHLQLSEGLVTRIDQYAMGMPGWAIQVRAALAAGAQAYANYLIATGPVEALAVLDAWCAPLLPLQLTEQMGLFAEPAAIRLQRQLQMLIDVAKQWARLGAKSTGGECARVIAAWADMVRAGGTPRASAEKK